MGRARAGRAFVVGLLCMGGAGVLPLCRAMGQSPQRVAGTIQFEVVSIKANVTGRRGNIGMVPDGYAAEDESLMELVQLAYGLRQGYQILGLPAWAKSAHYDIAAKVGGPDVAAFQKAGYSTLYQMFQPVLEDRFALRFHWEKRVLSTYTLTLAKKGSALKDSTAADDKVVHIEGGDVYAGAGGIVTTPGGRVISRAAPMRMLVQILEGEMNSIVVDQTGLKGTYDYELQLPRASAGAGTGSREPQQPGDSVAGSLYQIGLRMVPSKTEEPVLVVDGVQQPSAN